MNEQGNTVDLRAVALDIVTEVLENGGFLNRLLRQVLNKYAYLDRRDRAFLSRLCIGTVERKITLDACIDHISSLPVRKMKPFIRNLLRISAYQIYEMNGVKDYTICDEAVKIAKKRKFTQLTGFVNGILRSLIRERDLITEEDAVKPGDIVNVKVLGFDLDSKKISLSIKETLERPEPEKREEPVEEKKAKKEEELHSYAPKDDDQITIADMIKED